MRTNRKWVSSWRLAALLLCGLALLVGCDATTRTAVESGFINASSAFVGALLQAVIQLAAEGSTAAITLL
jgi:hypothetical protein